MTSRPLMLSTLAALLLTACATPGPTPVTDPEVRIQAAHFSVLPPSGQYWKVGETRASAVLFGKVDPAHYKTAQDTTHTLLAFTLARNVASSTDLSTPAALRSAVEREMLSIVPADTGRYKLKDIAYEPFRQADTDCLRYEAHVVETNNPRMPGMTLDMTSFGAFCRHPARPQLLVETTCSERLPAGHPSLIDAALRQECAHMFDSLQFGSR